MLWGSSASLLKYLYCQVVLSLASQFFRKTKYCMAGREVVCKGWVALRGKPSAILFFSLNLSLQTNATGLGYISWA